MFCPCFHISKCLRDVEQQFVILMAVLTTCNMESSDVTPDFVSFLFCAHFSHLFQHLRNVVRWFVVLKAVLTMCNMTLCNATPFRFYLFLFVFLSCCCAFVALVSVRAWYCAAICDIEGSVNHMQYDIIRCEPRFCLFVSVHIFCFFSSSCAMWHSDLWFVAVLTMCNMTFSNVTPYDFNYCLAFFALSAVPEWFAIIMAMLTTCSATSEVTPFNFVFYCFSSLLFYAFYTCSSTWAYFQYLSMFRSSLWYFSGDIYCSNKALWACW